MFEHVENRSTHEPCKTSLNPANSFKSIAFSFLIDSIIVDYISLAHIICASDMCQKKSPEINREFLTFLGAESVNELSFLG